MSAHTIAKLRMPKWGLSMTEGTFGKWLVEEGVDLSVGDEIAEVETEKISGVVEATSAGILRRKVAQPGDVLPVGGLLAVVADESVSDAEISAFIAASGTAAEAGEASTPAGDGLAAVALAAPAQVPTLTNRIKASPAARKLAKERGIDLSRVTPTGPDDRIVAEDVERAAAEPTLPAPVEAAAAYAAPLDAATGVVVPLTPIRRAIAQRLTQAWEAPHFAISMSADMGRVSALRELLLERTQEGSPRPTYSDVLTKVCAVALLQHPALNAHYEVDQVRIFSTVNIGIAVAIMDGLIVPVIRGVERKSVVAIAADRADLVFRTRAGKLLPDDLVGGTFTISDLGMYGVDRFFAVLNPPQVAILAVGAVEERAVVEAGQLAIRPRLELTLSCDHRAVDGATASEFLRSVKEILEEPGLAL
ncbi:MAG: 2-oxo acid dehydrogenase subunit E2 [Thermoleophilia bacterium]|nr:2-oxo acid dehydrogenase subunit E2 [Thermoleophilia bacterium]